MTSFTPNRPTGVSTRLKLHSLIDDVEIVIKELFEVMSTPKTQQKTDMPDTVLLMELLVQKDTEIKDTLKIASSQGDIQKQVDTLKAQVETCDVDIKQLQKQLKDAESILSTALYQARQKLDKTAQAKKSNVSSEELIKFAHRISASNAVAAPATWAPGDPRRPYPTDFEMRHGFLGKQGDLPVGGVPQLGSYGDTLGTGRQQNDSLSGHSGTSISWQPSQLAHPLTSHHSAVESRSHSKDVDDVGYMSSESSSSSSSDE